MRMFISFIFLLFLAGLTGFFAKKRGRDPVGWFLLSLLIGVFALLILFILPSRTKELTTDLEVDEDKILFGSHNSEEGGVYSKEWFYLNQDHEQIGPISFEKLQDAWEEGVIAEQTFVWCEGMTRWVKLKEMTMLHEALQGAESKQLFVKVR